MKEYDLITLGEVMLRLSPLGYERISGGETFEKRAGGSELNVAAGAALLGLRTDCRQMISASLSKTVFVLRVFRTIICSMMRRNRQDWVFIITRWELRPESRPSFMTGKILLFPVSV